MKTTESGNNPQISLRSGLRQGLRQRYILTGISILLTISAGILYWMLQQREAAAETRITPPIKHTTPYVMESVIDANITINDNVPVINWEGEFPHGSMFVIERSANSEAWQLVQKAPREEMMTKENRFRFTDEEAEGTLLKYRITCINPKGETLTSTEIETAVNPSMEQLLTITGIEPLQFANQFTITLEAEKEEPISFEILDNNSQPVYTEVYHIKKGENLIGFTRGEQLPKGVYIIRLSGSDESTAMTKLIKQ